MQLNLGKLPWYGQVGAFVVVAAAGVFAFYNFYVSEQQTQYASRQAELAKLQADINKGLATARKLSEFQAEVTTLERRLDALRAVLPEQKDYSELLRRIQTLATQSNLTIRSFTPQAVTTKQLHTEWPIGLEIDGTYHNLGSFFDKISKFPRIISVSNIRIRAKDKPDANSTITAECTATTFVLLDPKAAAAPAAKSGRGAPEPPRKG